MLPAVRLPGPRSPPAASRRIGASDDLPALRVVPVREVLPALLLAADVESVQLLRELRNWVTLAGKRTSTARRSRARRPALAGPALAAPVLPTAGATLVVTSSSSSVGAARFFFAGG